MQVIPVLDIQDGHVVRGVGGRRDEYRPIRSTITSSTDPCEVAAALAGRFAIQQLYVADLDAIAGHPVDVSLYQRLAGIGPQLLVDAGFTESRSCIALRDAGVGRVIVATETCPGPQMLHELAEEVGAASIVLGIDLNNGVLRSAGLWPFEEPLVPACLAAEIGIRSFLVLDVAYVGENTGLTQLELCVRLRQEIPQAEILTGGGVRHAADLHEAHRAGCDGLLIASALHDGRISPDVVSQLVTT